MYWLETIVTYNKNHDHLPTNHNFLIIIIFFVDIIYDYDMIMSYRWKERKKRELKKTRVEKIYNVCKLEE